MIAIDTCIVLWGIRGVEDPDGRRMDERFDLLLGQCDRDNVEVLIPFPAVIESMAKTPACEQSAYVRKLKEEYVLGVLDEDSALKAAQLQRVMGGGVRSGEALRRGKNFAMAAI